MYGDVKWTGKPNSFLGMPLNFTRYFITNKKIVVRKGFLNIKEGQVELYRVQDMSMRLPITQRIFRSGTIELTSKDADLPRLELKQIRAPYEIYNLIEAAIENQKREYGVLGRDIIGAAMHIDSDGDGSCDSIDADGNGIPDYDLLA